MFHDENLNRIHKESEDVVKEYHNKLDKISKDINLLEDVLVKSGIDEHCMDLPMGRHLFFENGRLRYLDPQENYGVLNGKALIQHKAGIRLECSVYLADFFERCMNKIEKGVKNAS